MQIKVETELSQVHVSEGFIHTVMDRRDRIQYTLWIKFEIMSSSQVTDYIIK